MRRGTVVVVALGLVVAACGESAPVASTVATSTTTTTTMPATGYDPDQVILRIDRAGGLVPFEFALTDLPEYILTGDGELITSAPDAPPGALPTLSVSRLSAAGVSQVVAAAEAAGLSDPLEDYGFPRVTDMPTTMFSLHTTGKPSEAAVYALSSAEFLDDPAFGLTAEQAEARNGLVAFIAQLADVTNWLGDDVIEGPDPYPIEALTVYLAPADGAQILDWPLGAPVGEPAGGYQCLLVQGDDLDVLLLLAEQADSLTTWLIDGVEHRALFRPVLPGEDGCSQG
jgi:hypothetical protein